jgi:hypothetical protein
MQIRPAVSAASLPAAAGLAVDACVHADLAGRYDAVTATFSQGGLFRARRPSRRRLPGGAFGWLVAAGGFALLVVHRYLDVGKLEHCPHVRAGLVHREKGPRCGPVGDGCRRGRARGRRPARQAPVVISPWSRRRTVPAGVPCRTRLWSMRQAHPGATSAAAPGWRWAPPPP